jgi:hypothetical protein
VATQATGTFEIKGWDEEAYGELEGGRKLSRASVTQAFAGDIEGDGSVEWLMCYRPDKTADFVGLQQLTGRVGDRSGSVVLQTVGTFDGTEARGDWTVVPGSGTDELAGLTGRGSWNAPHGRQASLSLDYDVE